MSRDDYKYYICPQCGNWLHSDRWEVSKHHRIKFVCDSYCGFETYNEATLVKGDPTKARADARH